MPYPLEVMKALFDAKKLIEKRALAEAAQLIENVWAWAEKFWNTLIDIESMEFLGIFSKVLKDLNQTSRQIKILERLCNIADRNLEELGIMATDNDIQWTGMDFIELGLAYLCADKIDDARKALEKGKYILEELGWLVEVDKILMGEATRIGPSPLVEKRAYQPSAANNKHHDTSGNFEALKKEFLGQDDSGMKALSDVAGQVVKILFMESVIDRSAIRPWDPTQRQLGADGQIELLDEILKIHAEDCHILDTDIPLFIGVPKRFEEQTAAHLKNFQYGGLRADQVHLLIEPEVPGFDVEGKLVIDGLYELSSYLAGGGMCVAHFIENGVLSNLWKDGIRWLLCGQIGNPYANVDNTILRHLPECSLDGIVEVVERDILPGSILLPLKIVEKTMCVDQRRLTDEERAQLGENVDSCTGTFWIRCEKLAGVFGIGCDQLGARWDENDWKGKLSETLVSENGILSLCDNMTFAITIPLWEVIAPLNLEFGKVGVNRAPTAK
jgi:hypothetical protein